MYVLSPAETPKRVHVPREPNLFFRPETRDVVVVESPLCLMIETLKGAKSYKGSIRVEISIIKEKKRKRISRMT